MFLIARLSKSKKKIRNMKKMPDELRLLEWKLTGGTRGLKIYDIEIIVVYEKTRYYTW